MLQIHTTNGDFLQAGALQEGYRMATQAEIDTYNLADKKARYIQATNREFEYISNNKYVSITTVKLEQWVVKVDKNTFMLSMAMSSKATSLQANKRMSFDNWLKPNTRIEVSKQDLDSYYEATQYTLFLQGTDNIYDAKATIVTLIENCKTLQELETLIFPPIPARLPAVTYYPPLIQPLAKHRDSSWQFAGQVAPKFDNNAFWNIFEDGKRPVRRTL